MSSETEVHNHHLNGDLPADIPEELKEFLTEIEGVGFEDAILQQASVYKSYQESGSRNRVVATDDEHIINPSFSSEDENEDDDGEQSNHEIIDSQEAMDEAYARTLQEEEYDEYFMRESNDQESGLIESPITSPSTHIASPDSSEDGPDPDNMGYEELLILGDRVGVEQVGLSADRLSRLPNSIYKSRMFSKNKEETCVVCQENFKFGKRVIRLPCSHRYHSKCIIEWLKCKKNCPICQTEVV